ncbi:amino acid permease [Corynebacterium silvaticum]|uniref:Amino acid permease n=1 Tax=Corynebacterium silvaticum TaxID=2320431 RepID=A0A7U5HLD8_9CORY|nr:amino acid permease [Corynebacterium silvaticum]ARU45917.1 amino acid permease [Corynebacterium silvaticum]MBH5300471.1 amino acid permease [Corynebacterium silvaticum]NOM64670.1 amino acid permease [Corynebacterium silvaticum]TFA93311.1 amino acid permease [Corynebacterium silvaticum]TFA96671.1 amino acid permease [Corynebacterium silvaticum]
MTEATSETGLGSGLKTRHLTMMGLGSAIGAGLFLGTGVGIAAAGPAVLIAYIISGIFVVFVMQMLGELAAARPASGSFSVYAEQAFGHWAGFSLGWLYWFMLTMVLGAEMTGAAAIMGQWFGIDPWIPALVCVVFFAVINFAKVGGFGEFEFWFAFIKVAVIIVFLIVGVLLIFGLLPGHDYVGTQHFLGDGFMPNGITGVATGLLAVAFAFGGTEIVTIAAAESEDPKTAIATAVRSVIWRISTFYLGSVLVISFLLPYNQIGGAKTAAQSPFTIILGMANIPGVVGFMEAIIVVALLSAFNAQIYATSRFVHSMAQRGNAPRMFASTNREGVPIAAVLLSMFFAFASVGFQYWNPAGLLSFLLNAVGGCLIVIWVMISLSYIKLHPELVEKGEITTVRMWCYPWLGWFTVVGFIGLTALMLSDDSSRSQITSVAVVFTALIILSFLTRKKSK